MAKAKNTAFFCSECGYESAKWFGQCPACKAWNTFVEEPIASKLSAKGISAVRKESTYKDNHPVSLKEINSEEKERTSTGIGELDRVLGGGIVQGSLVLVGGDPGIGKSTLLLQMCYYLSDAGNKVLYISGEESLRQIKLRAERIGECNDNLKTFCETNLDIIEEVLKIVSDFYRFEAPLKPGVKKTLEWFKERNIQMTVATSGNRELTEAALARNGILDYFEQIYTCTETGAGKDEPLIYLKAAESMQAEPNETLVFEDALHAAETAKKAGFVVIGVYDEENRKNISKMKEVCDCYCDRMDAAIENICLTI